MSLSDFVLQLSSSPMLVAASLLTLGVIFVNGWTDAPNAIATCVSTRAVGVRRAIIMAAVFNFLGVLIMTAVNSSVAFTIYNLADFGGDSNSALVALCAAMTAIVVWASAAWYFGIPTSESHALIAGISGASVAINGGFDGINGAEWAKVGFGILISTVLGASLGFVLSKLTVAVFRSRDRIKSKRFFDAAQTAGGAASAFMHGAQDGQKFMAIFLLAAAMAQGSQESEEFFVPLWLPILCSIVIALGTSVGGYRIIKSVGMDMVRLKPYQGFAADLAAAVCLLISSCTGLPVSTTHTKTTAIMGVGAARRVGAVDLGVVRELVLAWLFTFPGCGILGFVTAKIFLPIFR